MKFLTAPAPRSCAALVVFALFAAALPARADMRITEFMYDGTDKEFVEITNVGTDPVDLSGWSYSDSSRVPGSVALGAFGTVAPGASVILAESPATTFRAAWSLCDGIKVIGGNGTQNLGRNDEINIYDAAANLVDRLTYNDQVAGGGPRTSGKSGWVSAAGLGANIAADWTLSVVGDGEDSRVSSGGDIGSPGRSMRATVAFDACPPPPVGVLRITEFMYQGATNQDAEFVEFTNVGNAPLNLAGWSYSDSGRTPGAVPLDAFGSVQAGESVILTGVPAADFRTYWGLCSGVKVIGPNTTQNLGRSDEINVYDAAATLVDRLTYNDQVAGGGPRTNGKSAWVSAAGLGSNVAAEWTASTAGDGEGSLVSGNADVGSPGRSARATIAYDPCAGGSTDSPVITAAASPFIDLSGDATVRGVIGDPTDPAATTGIALSLARPDNGDLGQIMVAVQSGNPAVVDAAGIVLAGSGAARTLTILPHGVGYATITVTATDELDRIGTFAIHYAASAHAALPEATRFHTGASDASATIALDDATMLVADDETNVLRLYDRDRSGLPLAGFDVTASLALTDPDNPELDLEGAARRGERVYWTGSYSNSKNFHVRPNRHRVFATDLVGAGAASSVAYAGRYDWLLEDFVAWDHANGHGLGIDALGFAASSAEGVDSKTPAGFNVEGLAFAPDDTTAYVAFRAPQLPTNARHQALIVPVLDFDALVTGAAPGSRSQGSAMFGAPLFLDLGGRGIRSLDRNAAGQYLIVAGPAGDATGIAPADFRLYAWTGQPADAPFDLGVDLTALDVNHGSFESIAEVPANLGPGTRLQFLFDNGDSPWYDDGVAAKDLPDGRLKKAASLRVDVDVAFPAAQLATDGGSPQQAIVGHAFGTALGVVVTDVYGHPVAGVAVSFDAQAAQNGADATLPSTTATTGIDGRASVVATANDVAGSHRVVAGVGGVATSVIFELANLADAPASLAATGGTPQEAIVGQVFGAPLVVRVVDAHGNPVAGALVTFGKPATGASATLDPAIATTAADGTVQVAATANAIAGGYIVEAHVDGVVAPATFVLANALDPADMIFEDGFETAVR